jgi:hypothetical protein
MNDTADDLANFADVLAEGLSPELRAQFASADGGMTMTQIWEMVLRNHVAILDPPCFVRKSDKAIVWKEAFTMQYAPVVNGVVDLPRKYIDKPVTYALSTTALQRASKAVYEPGLGDWPTRTAFNMYRPAGYLEIAERPDVFLRHLGYLIPDRLERNLLLAFLKWMVQFPDKKMTFALLILGRRGTGKSWLSTFLQALFGAHNVLVIERGAKVADRFNADEKNKRVIFVDELVPDGKMDVAKAIVPKIIAPYVTIEGKGENKIVVPNRSNIIAVSNYENAIRIEGAKDRKWLIVRSTPTIWGADIDGNPTLETKEYYDRLFAMTKVGDSPADVPDEIKRCMWWLRTQRLIGSGNIIADFNGQGVAPMTATKEDVAAITETTIESAINGGYVDKEGPFRFELFSAEDVRFCFALDDGRRPKEIEAEVAAAMEEVGCRRVGPQTVYIPGKKKGRRLWCRNERLLPKYQAMTTKELSIAYTSERQGKPPDPVAQGEALFENEPADDVDNAGARQRGEF